MVRVADEGAIARALAYNQDAARFSDEAFMFYRFRSWLEINGIVGALMVSLIGNAVIVGVSYWQITAIRETTESQIRSARAVTATQIAAARNEETLRSYRAQTAVALAISDELTDFMINFGSFKLMDLLHFDGETADVISRLNEAFEKKNGADYEQMSHTILNFNPDRFKALSEQIGHLTEFEARRIYGAYNHIRRTAAQFSDIIARDPQNGPALVVSLCESACVSVYQDVRAALQTLDDTLKELSEARKVVEDQMQIDREVVPVGN